MIRARLACGFALGLFTGFLGALLAVRSGVLPTAADHQQGQTPSGFHQQISSDANTSSRLYVRGVNEDAPARDIDTETDATPVGSLEPASGRAQPCERSPLYAQLGAAEPQVRIDALIKLVDLQGSEALPTVIEALADSDETVRQFSLEKSEAAGLLLPPELLTDLVVRDSSERVRMLALHAVGNHPLIDEREKIVLVQYTINDPSPMLQMTASEILSQIENASLMREEDQRIRDEAAQTINEELPLDAPSD